MPWGNIAAGILPMDLQSCKVLIQHRSKEVVGNGDWSLIGGAINEVDTSKPIVNTKQSQYDVGTDFLPIDYAIRDDLRRDFKNFVEYSLKTELCEEGDYGCYGSGENLRGLKTFYQFGMFDDRNKNGKVTETTDKRGMYFTYLNNIGFVDRRFTPPMTWESLQSAWIDVEDLLLVANDDASLEEILPIDINPYFNGYYDEGSGEITRDDNDSVELLREFKLALQDPDAQSILRNMKQKCIMGNID